MKKMITGVGRLISRSPGRISILSYALLILAGTFLLKLPVCSQKSGVSFEDALFTATSASCVTGLSVLDISVTFTRVGQLIILALIQVGGIGIMVLSTVFLLSIGKKISLSSRSLFQDIYSHETGWEVISLVRDIIIFTLAIEFFGVVLLCVRFSFDMPFAQALYNSIFHSVSAFCNAGFSLFPTSFVSYRSDVLVNLTVCGLIILGGIGFIVMAEVKRNPPVSRKAWRRLSLHAKLVLAGTFWMLLASTVLFWVLEQNNVLQGLSTGPGILTSFFQSVNARTAGFNTVDISGLTNETLLITMIFMFVGTAPGSCGGGIKITSFLALVLLGFARFRGRLYPHVFYRRISEESINKALSLVMISLLVIVTGIVVLQQTEIGGMSHQYTRGRFLELAFETVSAFGTVGLSTCVTSGLSTAGQMVICLMMFIGRIGPLAVAIAVSRRIHQTRYRYAEENIMIG